MHKHPYDSSRKSLFTPGLADDFFQLGEISSDAALCAEMARLVYVKEEALLEEYLGRAGFIKNLTLGYGAHGTQLFIATRPQDQLTIISFRGTESDDPSDLFTDAHFTLVPWNDSSGNPLGQVHKGFAQALQKDELLEKLIHHVTPMTRTHRILMTGHSLGAALATLSACRMRPSFLYTFGSCRVGDAAFADAMRGTSHERFVNCCDLVSRIPPEEFGYAHVGRLRYIDRNGEIYDAPGRDAINADRLRASSWYLVRHAFLTGSVFSRDLADHAPINYVTGVMGIRE